MGGPGSTPDNSPSQSTFLQGAALTTFRVELAALSKHADLAISSCAPVLSQALEPFRRVGVDLLLDQIESIVSQPPCREIPGTRNVIPAVIKLAAPESAQGEKFADAAAAAWQERQPARAEKIVWRATVPVLPQMAILDELSEIAGARAPDLLQKDKWRDVNVLLARLVELRPLMKGEDRFPFEHEMAAVAKLVVSDAHGEARRYLDSMDRGRLDFAVLVIQEALHKLEPQRSFWTQLGILGQVEKSGGPTSAPYIRRIIDAAELFRARCKFDPNKPRRTGED